MTAGSPPVMPSCAGSTSTPTTCSPAQIATLDQLVARAAEPFAAVIARLVTIPGIGPRLAQVIVAETGGDMARFASSARLAAWAGLAPGDNESAGKRKRAAARKGNPHLQGRDGRSGVGRIPDRQPPGSTVPAAGPPVRQAQHQEGRGRCRAHPALRRLGGHESTTATTPKPAPTTTTSATSATTSTWSATTSRPWPGWATR